MSQRLLLNVTGVADGSGNLTFVFPVVAESHVWTGRASVVGTVPSAGRWTVKAGYQAGPTADGTPLGIFAGNGPYDNLQIWGGERLLYIGTGLTPGGSYTALFIGQSDWEGEQPMVGARLIQQDVRTVAGGIVTFRFPVVPQGSEWLGRTFIPYCTDGTWVASLSGGQVIGVWTGAFPYGPLHLIGGDELVITGTGVLPTPTQLACFLVGYSVDMADPLQQIVQNLYIGSGLATPPIPPGFAAQGCRISMTGNQAIANATPQALVFDTVDYDEFGGADIASHPTTIIVPADGLIIASCTLQWAASAAGTRLAVVTKNPGAVTIASEGIPPAPPPDDTTQSPDGPYSVVAGDTVSVIAYQTTGAPLLVRGVNGTPQLTVALLFQP